MRLIPALVSREHIEAITLRRLEGNLTAGICFSQLPVSRPLDDFEEILHFREATYYNTLKFDRRKRSYLVGRYAAKQAIAAFIQVNDLREIFIDQGIFNQPVVWCGDGCNIQVSIAHCENIGAAIAFPEAHPMGIDIEKTGINNLSVLETQMTAEEIKIMKTMPYSYEDMLTLFWTAKEALSKPLRTGLMTPFQVYEVDRVDILEDHLVSHYKNFAQYQAVSYLLGQYCVSIACPVKTEMNINSKVLKEKFNGIEENAGK